MGVCSVYIWIVLIRVVLCIFGLFDYLKRKIYSITGVGISDDGLT